MDCLAGAWEVKNRSRIAAERFEATYRSRESAVSVTAAAAAAAVAALVIVPMMVGRTLLMCDCELGPVVSDAAEWTNFNAEAFEREFKRVTEAACPGGGGGRMLEGCACEVEGACSCLVSGMCACTL